MPRFVLLYHECPPGYLRPSHWDLMLEAGEKLRTWAIARLPRAWQPAQLRTAALCPPCPQIADTDTADAEQLDDHRRAYLELEGPLGGERGSVTRIDEGTFTTSHESAQSWRIEVAGECWQGTIVLSQLPEAGNKWTVRCESDR